VLLGAGVSLDFSIAPWTELERQNLSPQKSLMENSVAKKYYRYGVLEGNHVEERFGLDHAAKLRDVKMNTLSETRDKFCLSSSVHGAIEKSKETPAPNNTELLANTTLTQTYHLTPEKEALLLANIALNQNTDRNRAIGFTHEGEKAHLIFGHGLNQNNFEKRELASTYNLSYGSHVKPKDFIFSKFDETTVPPVINPEDKVYIKNHIRGIAAIGDGQNFGGKKQYKHYDEFTKTFDAVQSKIAFRKWG